MEIHLSPWKQSSDAAFAALHINVAGRRDQENENEL